MAYAEQRYTGQPVVGRKSNLFAPEVPLWTERSNPKATRLNAVAWSPALSLFAAVGDADGTDAYIVTSPDGITWTERSNAKNYDLEGIAWSPSLGLFAACGVPDTDADAYLLTSPDGITWTERSNPSLRRLETIVWAPELARFVAVGASNGGEPTYIVYSSDGITWTRSSTTGLPGLGMVGLAWSPELSLFAAGGTNGTIITSPDGINWTQRRDGGTEPFMQCAWSGTNFVMVGFASGGDAMIFTSPDGITWTERSNTLNANLRTIIRLPSGQLYAFGNGVALNSVFEPGALRSRDDGVSWTRITGQLPTKSTAAAATISGSLGGGATLAYAPPLKRLVVVGASDGTDAYIATTDHLR